MALLATLLIEAILKEDLTLSVIWLTLILITKPQWAFAAILPLLWRKYHFFIKLILYSLASYVLLGLITLFAGGPSYVWSQFQDYINLLGRLGRDFPWRGPGTGFLGYNHSIKQVTTFIFGVNSSVLSIATILKLLLLIPLGITVVRRIATPREQVNQQIETALEFALLLYLGVFIWLDIVWEATLAIAIYSYLLPTAQEKTEKIIINCSFFPYAILDFWRLICYLAGSPILQDSYIKWDYSIYIPTTMIVILVFYILLLVRQWPWHTSSQQFNINT